LLVIGLQGQGRRIGAEMDRKRKVDITGLG